MASERWPGTVAPGGCPRCCRWQLPAWARTRRASRQQPAFALYGLRLQPQGIAPGPVEARITITDRDGYCLGPARCRRRAAARPGRRTCHGRGRPGQAYPVVPRGCTRD